MNKIKLKLNADLGGYKKGQIIKVNENETYWQRRIKDSKIDNCVETVKDIETKKDSKIIKKELKNDRPKD